MRILRRLRLSLWIAFTFLFVIGFGGSTTAFAHPGQPVAPHDLGNAWNTNFFLLLTLEISVLIYLWGVWQAWRRAGVGRGVSGWQCTSFFGAILALIVALVSPVDALSGALFSAHMAQHLVLIFVAAPLLYLSNLPLVMLWALPRRPSQTLGRMWNRSDILNRLWRVLAKPVTAWLFFAVAIWLWHTPVLYQATLKNETIHAIEHLTFLVSAVLFWRVILDTSQPKHLRYGIAIPYLFSTSLHSGVLGALMTFASQPWYATYSLSVLQWGLTPIQDQQLAGLFMWVPAGAVLMLLTIIYFGAWLGMSGQDLTHVASR